MKTIEMTGKTVDEALKNALDELKLTKENRGYTPHLTIIKQRPKRPVDIETVKKRAEAKLASTRSYTLKSIIVYHQPKERFIYVPYMEIPFN